jgi:GNAT superfamily N-acetyltransferase
LKRLLVERDQISLRAIVERERNSLRAWPAREAIELDGWILCASGGYTRRTNSVQPLAAGRLDPGEKIGRCERFYGDRGQPVVFKLTEASEPPGLEALLAARGYEAADPTSVQAIDLAGDESAIDPEARIEERPGEAWLEACASLNGVEGPHRAALRACLSIGAGSDVTSVALAVLTGSSAGLFAIATHPAVRGRGLGERIVQSALAWARDRSARDAWLQVVVANQGARRLYARMGFRELYRYWYRAESRGPTIS